MTVVTRLPFLMSPLILAVALAAPASSQALRNHDSSAPVDFAADRIEVQDRADRAVLSGNVRVDQGGLNLASQRLTIVYAGEVGQRLEVRRMDASGGVTVRSASETARGNFAVYDLNRRQITLVGNVSLEQGANRLSGGRLVIDLASGRSVIDGAAAGGTAPGVTGNSGGRVTGRFNVPQRGGN